MPYFTLQKCQFLCLALAYTSNTCNVNFFTSSVCYLGSQSGNNMIYQLTTNLVTVRAIDWVLLARQTAGFWFSRNEWSASAEGKFAILDQIENFRFI